MNYVVITVLVLFVVLLLVEAWALMETAKRADEDAEKAWQERNE